MVSAARRLHRAQTRWHALAGCRSCTTQRCKAAARLACRACTAHPQTKPRCRLPPRPASPRFLLTNHDIWDGWGSYEEATQNCPVFQASRSRGRRRRRHWCRCCFHAPAAPCCPCMPSVWQQPSQNLRIEAASCIQCCCVAPRRHDRRDASAPTHSSPFHPTHHLPHRCRACSAWPAASSCFSSSTPATRTTRGPASSWGPTTGGARARAARAARPATLLPSTARAAAAA